MREIAPIRGEASHQVALAEVRCLWGSAPGTEDGDRLDVLLVPLDAYEAEQHAIEPPDPIEAIEVRMAELGIGRAGLGEILGINSGRVSKILNRRRRLTIEMMRTLAMKLAILERCLLRPYDLAAPATTVRGARVHA
jgi:HTH-type transcriptional regulator/antitoxin HigA